jgi:molecular chaperone DnaJ
VLYTHYDYLELAPGASRARIEASYAALLERFGQGANDVQDLSGLVRMIHAAYQVLSNPESRRDYDAVLAAQAVAADEELKAALDSQSMPTFRRVQDVPTALAAVMAQLAA